MNQFKNIILLAPIVALFFAFLPEAKAQDSVAQSGVLFKLGQAINRTILSKPKARHNRLDMVNRVHYSTNVYAYEGQGGVNHDEVSSHGLFIHWNLDDPERRARPGHALDD